MKTKGPTAYGGAASVVIHSMQETSLLEPLAWFEQSNKEVIMSEIQRLSHSSWECKYHVVFIPKYRQKRIYGDVRNELKRVFHELCHRKECRIEEGYLMPDHVHMLISIPPKYSSIAHCGVFER